MTSFAILSTRKSLCFKGFSCSPASLWVASKKRLIIVFYAAKPPKARSYRREFAERRITTMRRWRGSVRGCCWFNFPASLWVASKKRLIIIFYTAKPPKARSYRREFAERRITTMRRWRGSVRGCCWFNFPAS